MNHTVQSKHITNAILVAGVLLLLPIAAHAEANGRTLMMKMEIGELSFNTGLDRAVLTSKGYTVNSSRQTDAENVDLIESRDAPFLKLGIGVKVSIAFSIIAYTVRYF